MGRLRNTNRFIRICGLKCRPHLHGLTGGIRIGQDDMYVSCSQTLIAQLRRSVGLNRSEQLYDEIRFDLRKARIKTAIGNLTHRTESSM